MIYLNPRTDNQHYKGKILHVDMERGFCLQLSGQRSLFVHKLDKLEVLPKVGENLKIFYVNGAQQAKITQAEIRQSIRRL